MEIELAEKQRKWEEAKASGDNSIETLDKIFYPEKQNATNVKDKGVKQE